MANRAILFYALEGLSRAGITEVAIIVAPETGDQVRTAVGDGTETLPCLDSALHGAIRQ